MPVWTIIATLAVAAVLLGAWFMRRARTATEPADMPFARRARLLSPAARQFLNVLDEATGPDYRVFARVAAVDALRVLRPPRSAGFRRAIEHLRERDFDFVICSRADSQIVCAVELDERSRHQHNRGRGDPFLADACRVAGLPLLRVIARREYDLADMRQRVLDAMAAGRRRPALAAARESAGAETGQSAVPTSAPGERAPLSAVPSTPAPQAPSAPASRPPMLDDATDAPPTRDSVLTPALMASITHSQRSDQVGAPECPKCGSVMVRRHVHIGRHPGGDFWSCIHFPNCRGIVPIVGRAASFGP
jgi:hypothetical protein